LALILVYVILRIFNSALDRGTGIPLLAYIPVFGGICRTVREARWLAAFTLGLEAGETADRALEKAGAISGGTLEKRSREAARMVGSGHAIGQACIRCKVLAPWLNHRLQLIDWRGNYIEAVRGLVEMPTAG
jgi:type II secretory pathway component PulF